MRRENSANPNQVFSPDTIHSDFTAIVRELEIAKAQIEYLRRDLAYETLKSAHLLQSQKLAVKG